MTKNTKDTVSSTSTSTATENQYHRSKLVMNVENAERQELVDRLVIYMIKTKKYRTRSDAIYHLLKERLDQLDAEEKKREVRVKAVH